MRLFFSPRQLLPSMMPMSLPSLIELGCEPEGTAHQLSGILALFSFSSHGPRFKVDQLPVLLPPDIQARESSVCRRLFRVTSAGTSKFSPSTP